MWHRYMPRRAAQVLLLGLSFCIPFASQAGVPFVKEGDLIALEMPGIPGDDQFAASNGLPPGSIPILSVGGNVITPNCTPGSCLPAKALPSNIAALKKLGASSAALYLAAVLGSPFKTATFSFYRINQGVPSKYYSIRLRDVRVAKEAWAGTSGVGDSPDTEEIELAYSDIMVADEVTGWRACYDVVRVTAYQC